MKDLVSQRWFCVAAVASVAPVSIVWSVVSPYGSFWTGLAWLSFLALSVALWMGRTSSRSIAQVIGDVEAEPMLAAAVPTRVGLPVPKQSY